MYALLLIITLVAHVYIGRVDSENQLKRLQRNLNKKRFKVVVSKTELVLGVFYAAWCGYCKSLIPELEKAAMKLEEMGLDALIVTVDGSKEHQFAVDEGLDGYPTINLYKGGKKFSVYKGSRDANDIAEYIRTKSFPSVQYADSFNDFMVMVQPFSIAGLEVDNDDDDKGLEAVDNLDSDSSDHAIVLALIPKTSQEANTITSEVDISALPPDLAVTGHKINVLLKEYDGLNEDMKNGKRGRDTLSSLLNLKGKLSKSLKSHIGLVPRSTMNMTDLVYDYYYFARNYDAARFYITDQIEFLEHFNVVENSLVIFTLEYPNGKLVKIADYMGVEDLQRVVVGVGSARILDFTEDKAIIDTLPVKEHVLLFVKSDPDHLATRALIDEVNRISGKFHGRLLFVTINESEFSVLQFFNLKPSDLPQAVIVDMRSDMNLVKYIMTSDFLDDIEELIQLRRAMNDEEYSFPRYHLYEPKVKVDASNPNPNTASESHMYQPLQPGLLEKFLDTYLDGMLRRSLFSERDDAAAEKISTSASSISNADADADAEDTSTIHGKVTSLVGLNFIEHLVSQSDVDTLAFFYAPWCTFCKAAEPIFYEIAGLLGNSSRTHSSRSMTGSGSEGDEFKYLSVVQIDATRNEVDHPRVKIQGFPSIQLFLRGDSVSPLEYEGEYTTTDLLAFLSQHRVPINKSPYISGIGAEESEKNEGDENDREL